MSSGGRKRTRNRRVSSLELPPGQWVQMLGRLRRGDVLARLAMCLLSAVAVFVVIEAWDAPFPYRTGYTPTHEIRARVAIEHPDARTPQGEISYPRGELLAAAGEPLSADDVDLLRREHEAVAERFTSRERFYSRLYRSLAIWGLIVALYCVCGYHIVYRKLSLSHRFTELAAMLLAVVMCVGLARWVATDPWRAELIWILLLGMTICVAYGRELALMLTSCAALLVAIAIGSTLGEFLSVVGVTTASVLLLGRIRSRSKLIQVGLISGAVAFVLTVVAGVLEGQPPGTPLVEIAGRNAVWAVAAGFLITGLLPFIERVFGVLTEISLLELGDVALPLLQELVRRAPGTYNHSINVASMAEAAADAIGANGLLVRVGAYFHDIGKMFKPGYFVENATDDTNRHDALVPAMSTLIIIAHVKDGADLARQHHLPRTIIEFIEQHHGTTLVEYFYHRASEQKETNPDAADVEENSFRYPGPKPQTRETGVLMLADAVESAAHVLVEPTPARIESLVDEITMKRLLDGQFDECSLDLRQLRTIENSLVKSLTAVYHGRVKYPDQRTA